MSWYCTTTEHRHVATPGGHSSSPAGYSHWRVSGARTMDVPFELAPASVTVPPGSRKRMEAIGSRASGDPVALLTSGKVETPPRNYL